MNPLTPPSRVLLGPGPSDVPASVLAAMGQPTVGHLDPYFLQVMDEIRVMLRTVFGTDNALTIPMSGTGSSGMETCLVNLIEPGDHVLVAVNGVFGTRMAEVARRCGAEVLEVHSPWGRAVTAEALTEAAGTGQFKLLCVVHAETSTGVLQDLAPMRQVADAVGAMLVVDAVTSLGGMTVDLDKYGVDAAYSGTQKCLSCPPGLAPISFSARAMAALAERKTPVQSWYLDLSLISSYWGAARAYHHTAPINMLYGLHESLRLVLEEGLQARERRHYLHGRALVAGLVSMGLEPMVPEGERLPQLTAVALPEGLDEARVRKALLARHGLEIGGGLGAMKGKAWRIGLMGHSASRRNVTLCLAGLAGALAEQGFAVGADPVAAANAVYEA